MPEPARLAQGKGCASPVIPARSAPEWAAAVHPSGADAEARRDSPAPEAIAAAAGRASAEPGHEAAQATSHAPMAERRFALEGPTTARTAVAAPGVADPAGLRRAHPAQRPPHRGRAEPAVRIAGSACPPLQERAVADLPGLHPSAAVRNAVPGSDSVQVSVPPWMAPRMPGALPSRDAPERLRPVAQEAAAPVAAYPS
jgi:hypothetical protein